MKFFRGFTLLEVLVAVAILGLGLTAILSAQAGSFASAAYARDLSLSTGLLRCKMTELEEHLLREGFQETDETGAGPCCEGDETPNMKCAWTVERPVFPEAKFGDLNVAGALNFGGPAGAGSSNPLTGALGILGGGSASPLGNASSMSDIAKTLADANNQAAGAASSFLGTPGPAPSTSSSAFAATPSGTAAPPSDMTGAIVQMAMSFVYPSLKAILEASTRRITTTLTFREGRKEYSVNVVEWFSIPQAGLTSNDDLTASMTSTSTSTTTGVRTSTSTSTKTTK